jgi:hypothetical protein
MKEHTINNLNNFISGWYLDDHSICDKLITHHNSSKKHPGKIDKDTVDESIKKSLDCYLDDKSLFIEYQTNLQLCVNEYIKKYNFANDYAPWSITQYVNLQQYLPGMGFYRWHSERTCGKLPEASRHLVFMTYLNDVLDGGETEFYYQKIKIQPKKGLTLIWPADWTFTHRGLPSAVETKYIATGWFNYI